MQVNDHHRHQPTGRGRIRAQPAQRLDQIAGQRRQSAAAPAASPGDKVNGGSGTATDPAPSAMPPNAACDAAIAASTKAAAPPGSSPVRDVQQLVERGVLRDLSDRPDRDRRTASTQLRRT